MAVEVVSLLNSRVASFPDEDHPQAEDFYNWLTQYLEKLKQALSPDDNNITSADFNGILPEKRPIGVDRLNIRTKFGNTLDGTSIVLTTLHLYPLPDSGLFVWGTDFTSKDLGWIGSGTGAALRKGRFAGMTILPPGQGIQLTDYVSTTLITPPGEIFQVTEDRITSVFSPWKLLASTNGHNHP